MLSELQIKNIGTVFNILDHDNDGEIEREDFEGIAAAIAEGVGLAADSPHRERLLDGYLGWWEQIRSQADTDQDGRVTRDEYVTAVDQGMLEDPNYLERVAAAGDAVFDAADTDGDGQLAEAEMAGFYVAAGVSAEIASGAFQQLDSDGDGKIGRDELHAGVIGVFASKGPEEVGANMLGNV